MRLSLAASAVGLTEVYGVRLSLAASAAGLTERMA